jgi:hypothetical protein
MSKNINVNPGQYKEGGRERMGEHLGQEKDKKDYVEAKKSEKPAGKKQRKK